MPNKDQAKKWEKVYLELYMTMTMDAAAKTQKR
jgi:hypothetical protein